MFSFTPKLPGVQAFRNGGKAIRPPIRRTRVTASAAALMALGFLTAALFGLDWATEKPIPTNIDVEDLLSDAIADKRIRGPDPLSRSAVIMPVTVALLSSAAAHLGHHEHTRSSIELLLAGASKKGTGWGLPVAWDAFGDGTTNPPDTIYGHITALGVAALLDAFELTQDNRYRDAALTALDHYARYSVPLDSGIFMAFSDQPSDRVVVHSTSALLMGQYARAGIVFGREDFNSIADALFRTLWAERWETQLGAAWPYSRPNPSWNDALHASSVGLGIATYANHRQTAKVETRAVLEYLRHFITKKHVSDFVAHADLKAKYSARPAPSSGVGMLMAAIAELNDCSAALAVARMVSSYTRPDGTFGFKPNDQTYYPSDQAHVLFGLAAVRKHCGS